MAETPGMGPEGPDQPIAGEGAEAFEHEGQEGLGSELTTELTELEAKVFEVAAVIERLQGENDQLRRELHAVRRECELLRQERGQAVGRLNRIIAKVDALRGEA